MELLTKEPHYALQLSELLQISQQAVVKHLGILEKAGFVSVDKVPSEKGGPPRKVYKNMYVFGLWKIAQKCSKIGPGVFPPTNQGPTENIDLASEISQPPLHI